MTNLRVTTNTIKELAESLTAKFHHFEDTTTTICVLFLPNGFSVAIGESACVDPANFDAEFGKQLAFQDAHRKAVDALWQLEGYALKKELDNANTDS